MKVLSNEPHGKKKVVRSWNLFWVWFEWLESQWISGSLPRRTLNWLSRMHFKLWVRSSGSAHRRNSSYQTTGSSGSSRAWRLMVISIRNSKRLSSKCLRCYDCTCKWKWTYRLARCSSCSIPITIRIREGSTSLSCKTIMLRSSRISRWTTWKKPLRVQLALTE